MDLDHGCESALDIVLWHNLVCMRFKKQLFAMMELYKKTR